ncbi:unannotated protein [freshwater metagenome]|uniref:Unannotated protein n=1 Tax=freshwater metagenome TaxID=449393 RepID=A0A6J6PS56_9ZZZZ
MSSCRFDFFEAADVEVEGVLEAVRQLARLERLAQVAHRVLDGETRLEARDALDLVRIDVVGADVVRRRGHDRDIALVGKLLLHDALGDQRDLHDRQVLEPGVEDLAGNLCRIHGQHHLVDVTHVLHMQVGTLLRAAEHGDLVVVDRMIGQDVHREVKALARGVTTKRRGTDDRAHEIGRLVLEQQRLAHALVLVVEGERHQRMILRHVGMVRDPVHGAGGRVDEALHAGLLGGDHHRLESVEVDRGREALVELEARVVGDARQVDDGLDSLERLGELGGIADVSFDHLQVRIALRQELVPEIHDVVGSYLVAEVEQLGYEQAADIAGGAGDEDVVEFCHDGMLSEKCLNGFRQRRAWRWNSRRRLRPCRTSRRSQANICQGPCLPATAS